ncbi:MAG TPA: hypothetical protein VH813_02830 [Candidatus Limnocylindrales bacterium]|jgi:hypothetical protein
MDPTQPVLVEDRIRDLRRTAADLRLTTRRGSMDRRPGRARRAVGGWLISAGHRLTGTTGQQRRASFARS